MLGANTTISVARVTQGVNKQRTYAAAHRTGVSAYREPVSDAVLLASDGPVGKLEAFYTDELTYMTEVQESDLITDATTSKKYVVTAIKPWEGYVEIHATVYDSPDIT